MWERLEMKSNVKGWKYYNHAAIPTCAPHETPDLTPIKDGTIWNKLGGGTPFLVRWTTEWDCSYETNWWYTIKDTPFDISAIKSKRRYEINKGNKHFQVKEINPSQYVEQLYVIAKKAYETYPASYRPNITLESYIKEVESWNFYKTYGAFEIEDKELCGFACLLKDSDYIDFVLLKVIPEKEKFGINASMVYKIVKDHDEFLKDGGYICDGARSIQHETAFQNYLEKYFGFRKAFCKLHIVYKKPFDVLIKIIYPFRIYLRKFDRISKIHQLILLLRMEEIVRENNA